MPERQQDIESFGDSQVQALFDKFLATPEPLLNTGDLMMQRVLAEVQLVYGNGAQSQSPLNQLTQRLADWLAGFRPRAVVIAFSSVAVAALLVFSIAVYNALPAPVSIAATVPSGEVLVLKPHSDSFRTYRTGDTFQLAEGDQIIARTGSVQLEPFPQQYADIMPGAQVELVTVDNEDGSRHVELFVIDGQVRNRGFEPIPAGDRYFVSTASLRAEFDSNDFEIDAVSPTRTIVTTRDGTAQIEAPSGSRSLFAGQAAEVGERMLLIYDIAPLQEGPGEIALAETPPAAADIPDDSLAIEPPTAGEQPVATLTALPIPRPDSAPPVTGASGGYITSTGADSGSALTVSRVSFEETQAEPVLVLSGYGPTGSSVQVLVEHQAVVTATVSTEGTWMASTPVNTIGRFAVDVVAVNDAGEVVASANAAQMEVGPPVKTPVPTPAEQSGIIIPPGGATATWTPGSGSGAPTTATKTPTRRPTAAPSPTDTTAPINFVAPVLPPTSRPAPTATATPEKSTPQPQDGPPILFLVPSPTPSDTPTSSATPKPSATNSATPLPTSTALPTATSTKVPVATSTGTATTPPVATATNTPLPVPSTTATATSTPTRTQAPVATATTTATSILPTATPTLPPLQPTADSNTNTNLPPAGDTPAATSGVFPTPTPTVPAIVPTATPTTRPPTATATSAAVPPTPTSAPPLANAPGLNDSTASDGTTNSGTLPAPTVAAPTVAAPTATPTAAPPTATPTSVPPTATPAAVAPTATATQAAALSTSPTGNTTTSDAPPPAPATTAPTPTAVPPTAIPPTTVPPTAVPPTAVPTNAAVPSSSVSQPTGNNTTPSDSVTTAPAATSSDGVSVAAPAATEPAPVSNLPAEATAVPAATSAAVDAVPPAVDAVATPTN